MVVRIASENDRERWNQFVDQEGGSFFQYFDWKYIYEFKTSKHHFIPLIIENDSSEILGIFPIEENLQLIYGSLASLPLGASDGYLIKGDLTEYEKIILIQSFLDFIDAKYSESHSCITIREHLYLSDEFPAPSSVLTDNGYIFDSYAITGFPCTHILKMEKPFEEKIWNRLWSKKLRKRIRHAKKSGAEILTDNDFLYIDDFYGMQIESVKKFGLVERKEIYEQILKIFRGKIKLFICLRNKTPISAAMCYYTPTMAYLAMAPYFSESENYLTNTLPICASIQYTCDHGYQYYEMGITKTHELAFHKDKFGGKKITLKIYKKRFSRIKMFINGAVSTIKHFGKKMFRT